MLINLLDVLLEKMQTQDFWRGLLYVAAGLGAHSAPEYASTIIPAALVVSGVLHSVWQKAHPKI